MKRFKETGLSQNLLKILEEINFNEPSEIQEKVIPIALAGKDVIGESATGSGKTLAFAAPIIEKVQRGKGLQALILAPTRELTNQDAKSFLRFSKYNSLKIVSIYGGVSIAPQIGDLRTADIVVGTPGRILDHISRSTIDLSKVRFLVLDEADRMLDMGFLDDVTKIIECCPENRQTFLFSATISEEIVRISKRYMKQPVEISVENYIDPSKLDQVFYDVPSNQKFSLLVHLLKAENSKLVMVFCNTKRNADFIGNNLRRYGFDALTLHGDLNQNQRNRVLEQFHKSSKFILVCTDVAARGLDIKNVSHIYNYDSPKTNIEYIHRIGRTARAGKEGKAITILSERDYENFRRVSRDEYLNIKSAPLPEFEKVFIRMSENKPLRSRDRNFSRERSWNNRSFSGRRKPFFRRKPQERRDEKSSGREYEDRRSRSFGRRWHSRNFHKRGRSYRQA